GADRGKLPRAHLRLVRERADARPEVAELGVAELGGEIAVELVAAEDLPRGVLVVAADAAAGAAAPVFGFRLSDTRAEIQRAPVHLCGRRKRESRCGKREHYNGWLHRLLSTW